MVLASMIMKMKCFKKQPQFNCSIAIRFCIFVATALLCSLSHAQLQFREPQSETMNFQRVGLDSAMAEVACAAGQPSFQKAVIFQYEDEKPQYIYGDDGTRTCVAGNCMQSPAIRSANRTQNSCDNKARMYRAKVFGPDRRDDKSAFIPPSEYSKYSAVGGFECKVNGEFRFRGSGMVLGGQDTIFTDAHLFIDRKTCTQENVSDCRFILLKDGHLLDVIPVKYLKSPWQLSKNCGDPSLDYGAVKLVRPIDPKLNGVKLNINTPPVGFPSSWNVTVDLISYHSDVKIKKNVVRRTSGNIHELPSDAEFFKRVRGEGFTISKPENIVVSDYASNHGSSGGAVFEGNKVVGIHMGSYDPEKRNDFVFSKTENFNYFLLFDKDMAQLILDTAKAP